MFLRHEPMHVDGADLYEAFVRLLRDTSAGVMNIGFARYTCQSDDIPLVPDLTVHQVVSAYY